MTESQKKCFMAVAEHLSFSKAAEVLYVSQPAVSKSINALEAELGVSLFARQGKYVSLTRAGEIFRDFLEDWADAYRDAMESMARLEENIHSGSVTIGCDTTWNAGHFFPRLAEHFAGHWPDIRPDIMGLDPDCFIQALRDREVDVTIMYAADAEKWPGIATVPFGSIDCGFLAPAGLEADDASGLRGQTFLVVDSASEKGGKLIYNKLFIDIYKEIDPEAALKYCRNLSAAQLAVSCGKGVMFADGWTSAVNNPEFRYYPIGRRIDLCLAYLGSSAGTHVQFFAEEAARLFRAEV